MTNYAVTHRQGVVAVIVERNSFRSALPDGQSAAPTPPRLLVIRRAQAVVAPGAYCFPGGGIEPGETEPEALIREIREELGTGVEPLRRVWESTTAWGVRLGWWLARLDPHRELAPNPAEVESCHWLTPAEMARLEPLLSSNVEFLAELEAGRIELGEA